MYYDVAHFQPEFIIITKPISNLNIDLEGGKSVQREQPSLVDQNAFCRNENRYFLASLRRVDVSVVGTEIIRRKINKYLMLMQIDENRSIIPSNA